MKDDDDEEDEEEEEGEGEEGGGKVTEAYNSSVSGSGSTNPGVPSPSRGAAVSGGSGKSYMKHSDSSFGLHSPDSFNDDVQVTTGLCIVWTQQANCP